MNDNWIKTISTCPKLKKYSQTGEEGYLKYILDNVGPGDEKFLVDIGAGDGFKLSNTRLFKEDYGYTAVLIDGDPKGAKDVYQHWITRENISDILAGYNCKKGFSLLSLDLDGNDYDILEAVLKDYQPRVVVAEINGTIPIQVSKKIKYDPNHTWKNNDYYGFSFSAALKLARNTGYRIVLQTDALNVYLVRRDLLIEPDQPIAIPFKSNQYHPHDPSRNGDWEEVK